MAAVRAAGAGALLSHRSAAALWGLRPDSRARVDVTVQGSTGRARAGVDVHSGALIADRDRSTLDGIPCTSLARTLLDLATVLERPALARAIDRAEGLRAFDMAAVEEVLERCHGRQGTGALRETLVDHLGPTITRSDAEDRFLEILEEAGLARPKVNCWIPLDAGSGYRPDFLWPDKRLIVEVDSRTHHSTRRAFVHDRRRDRRLALAGYQTYRYPARDLFDRPAAVVEELQRLLAAASRMTAV
jgi:very-short-patch-repair endonuclease